MSLIAILFALAAERFLEWLEGIRRFDWFERYADWVKSKLAGHSFVEGPLGVILIVSPVLCGVWLFAAMLGQVAWVFEFIFAVLVLVFSVGPRDLARDTQHYLDAMQRGDSEGAVWHASDMLGHKVTDHPAKVAQTIKENLLIAANDRLLGVFFWFVVLGPVGAILFRLACICKTRAANEAGESAASAYDLYKILTWPSARLCVLGYSLAGSFVDTLRHLDPVSDLWKRNSEELMVACGLGAMHQDRMTELADDAEPDLDGVMQALALVKRTVIAWVTIFAVMTLVGWFV